MTLRYARIASRTVADEYFAVTEKVEALYGQPAQLPADAIGPKMARLRREHHRMLGNGWCTRPPLRLTRPGQLPAPAAGPDSLQVLDEAVDQLARLRTPYWLGDSAVRLHALASLIAQAQQLLPQAVHDARDQELTWTQIGELLNVTAATAARRYRNNQ